MLRINERKVIKNEIFIEQNPMSNFTFYGGRFTLLRELGSGATATVQLAFDTQTNRHCALKILAPSYMKHPEAFLRMSREFQSLKQLDDPHILKIYEFFKDPLFFSMEFIDGHSLSYWIKTRGRAPEGLLWALGKTLSRTLHKAHQSGIIHRDIKPSNILITPAGDPKIVDFGLLRDQNSMEITKTGVTMGTLGYISPEQCSDAKAVDHRTDIYSLGVTLLCLGCGSEGLSINQLLEACTPYLSSRFLRLLMRATLRNPQHRIASMDELHRGLQRISPAPAEGSLYIPLSDVPELTQLSTLPLAVETEPGATDQE